MNRCVKRTQYNWDSYDPSWVSSSETYYLYAGMQCIEELNAGCHCRRDRFPQEATTLHPTVLWSRTVHTCHPTGHASEGPSPPGIIVNPDEHIPDRLVNDLYLVSEMATEPGMDDLLDIAQEHGIDLTNGSEPTPADIAVEMWLKNPELLEEKHGEQFIFHPRSMESFQGRALSVSECPSPTKEDLSNLEHDLREWFEQKNRGRYIKQKR